MFSAEEIYVRKFREEVKKHEAVMLKITMDLMATWRFSDGRHSKAPVMPAAKFEARKRYIEDVAQSLEDINRMLRSNTIYSISAEQRMDSVESVAIATARILFRDAALPKK